MRGVVVERTRIGEAAAGEAQPRLAGEEGIASTGPSAAVPIAAPPAAASAATGLGTAGVERPEADAAAVLSTSTRGSSQSMPREPLRTMATSSPARRAAAAIVAATSSAPHRDGGGIARDEDRSSRDHLVEEGVELVRVEPADRPAVDHRRRPAGAEAQAVDGLERDARGRSAAGGCRARFSARRPAPRSPSTGRPRRGRALPRAGRRGRGGNRGRR